MEVKIASLQAGNEQEGYKTMYRVVAADDPENHIKPEIFATPEEAEKFAESFGYKVVK